MHQQSICGVEVKKLKAERSAAEGYPTTIALAAPYGSLESSPIHSTSSSGCIVRALWADKVSRQGKKTRQSQQSDQICLTIDKNWLMLANVRHFFFRPVHSATEWAAGFRARRASEHGGFGHGRPWFGEEKS